MKKHRKENTTYYLSREIAAQVDTYPHKLREKVKNLGLEFSNLDGKRALSEKDTITLLNSYLTTMRNGKRHRVKSLLAEVNPPEKITIEKFDNLPKINLSERAPAADYKYKNGNTIAPAPKSPPAAKKTLFPDLISPVARFLKTEKALLLFNLALITVQATFVRDLFTSVSANHWVYSYIYGFGYELTGLTLALNGSTRWALRLFAVFSGLIIALELGFFAELLNGSEDLILMGKQLILSSSLPLMSYAFGSRYLDRIL